MIACKASSRCTLYMLYSGNVVDASATSTLMSAYTLYMASCAHMHHDVEYECCFNSNSSAQGANAGPPCLTNGASRQ